MVSKRVLLSQIRAGQNVTGCLAGIGDHSSVSLFQANLSDFSAASSSGPWSESEEEEGSGRTVGVSLI